MKKLLILLAGLFTAQLLPAQQQLSIGSAGTSEIFNDARFDPNNGGTIYAGSTGVTGVGNGTDIYLVKLNAARQVVWERVISNPGDDVAYKLKICANGDYLVVGRYFQSGRGRGFICRINATTGNINWNATTLPIGSTNGDVLYDVVELANGNIAAAGTQNYAPSVANSMVILFNSTLGEITKVISNYSTSDEFETINLLPNGTLVACGHYYNGTFYEAKIIEFNPNTLAVTAQFNYIVNLSVPAVNTNINTLWPAHGYTVNNSVIYDMAGVSGVGTGNSVQFIYTYTPGTGNLTGRLFYHNTNAGGFTFYPVTATDYILAQSNGPAAEYVSRYTNGVVAYDMQINTNTTRALNAIDVNGANLFLGGATPGNDAYAFFGNTTLTATTSPCVISAANALVSQANTPTVIAGSSTNTYTMGVNNQLCTAATLNPALQNNPLVNICGAPPCPADTAVNVTKCNNEDITLSARAGTSWSWSPATGLSAGNVQNPVCSAGSGITYIVTITNANNCTYRDTVRVTVNNCHCEDSCSWGLTGNLNVLNRNFIGSINNADFKIRTNNTQRMVVAAGGNVGINTAAPAKQLEVNGETRIGLLPAAAVNDRIVLANGTGDLRSLAATGNTNQYLSGNGTWQTITGGGGTVLADQGVTIDINTNTVLLGDRCKGGGGKFQDWREININNNNLYFNSDLIGKLFMGNTNYDPKDCRPLNTRLEISSSGLRASNNYLSPLPSTSGLRFTDLTALEIPIDNKYGGVLSLDQDGDVIWVKSCCGPVAEPQLKSILDRITALEKQVEETKSQNLLLKNQLVQVDVLLSKSNSIVLNQNVPNPFAENTMISYYIPGRFTRAQLVFSTVNGEIIKTVELKNAGKGQVNVYASDISSGLYTYTLVVDGKIIDTKKMLKQ